MGRGGVSWVNGANQIGLAREEAQHSRAAGGWTCRGQESGGGQWEEGGNHRLGQEHPCPGRPEGLPSLDMPTSKHFCSRQYWQRFRVTLLMIQFLSR